MEAQRLEADSAQEDAGGVMRRYFLEPKAADVLHFCTNDGFELPPSIELKDFQTPQAAAVFFGNLDLVLRKCKCGGLLRLELPNASLAGPIPAAIGRLAGLKTLALSGNQLSGTIPASMGQLVNLEFLCLDDNALTGPVPPEVGAMVKLKQIRLYENRISEADAQAAEDLLKKCLPECDVYG
jgi:Leucine-rich repeat (LRR) protein